MSNNEHITTHDKLNNKIFLQRYHVEKNNNLENSDKLLN